MFLFWGCTMEEEYRKAIMEILQSIEREDLLIQLYSFIKGLLK
jgi:hypothetical protein